MTEESKSRFGQEKTHSDGRLPSPVNAPLASDVIWLEDRELRDAMCQQVTGMFIIGTYSDVRLPSPVNAPVDIDVSLFPLSELCNTMREPVQDTLITTATYSDVRLLSPVNAPSAIDVIA